MRWHRLQDARNGVGESVPLATPPAFSPVVEIDRDLFADGKLPVGDAPLNLRALVKKRIELIAVPVVILVLGVLRFEATIMWIMWPALAIGGGGFAWWSVLQARTRVVWIFRKENGRVVLEGNNWLRSDAEKLPEAAKLIFGSQPEYWIDAMDPSKPPIAFDAHTIERPSHVTPALVARNIHQQDVHTFSRTKASRRANNVKLGVYGFVAAALLVFIFAVLDKYIGDSV